MATTDTRPGFRLPWNSDRADAEANGTEPAEAAQATDAEAVAEPATDVPGPEASAETNATAPESAAPVVGTAETEAATNAPVEPEIVSGAPAEEPKAAAKASGKKPNKFLADLTRAMQATAETERNDTLERFAVDAKAATERVHTAAADETAELRRVADDDVAGIRDWSKTEIARIREETENRISGRKAEMERELELHGGTVEQRIERINAKVTSFEGEVADFYERLFAEEDPTRFAAMAEQLPEPPSLDLPGLDDAVMIGMPAKAQVEAPPAEPVVEAVAEPSQPEVVVETTAEAVEVATETVEVPEAQAAPETPTEDGEAPETSVASESGEAETTTAADDPRLTALELTPNFEAAEAEAALTVGEAETGETPEEIPTIADEVLAARLAGLVPEENAESPIQTTKVVVTGLVSVASIAGFKRHLGRLQGVTTVGVSSGPDGEFVFSVHHVATMDLAAGIAGLPGFESRITNQGEGSIEVAARDPEAHD